MASDIINIVKRNQVLLLVPAALLAIAILRKYDVDEIVIQSPMSLHMGEQSKLLDERPMIRIL